MKYKIIFTCEHAGQQIFSELKKIKLPSYILNSHRAYDVGALSIAKKLSLKLSAPLIVYDYTRLILDANRSEDNHALWGTYGKTLSKNLKIKLFKKYYLKFRYKTIRLIDISKKPVLHLSVHSMSTKIGNQERDCDVSLLYDPSRKKEAKLCKSLKYFFELYGLKCRLNYPYLGVSDGHCTKLRKSFSEDKYLGIEFELNQKNLKSISLITEILIIGLNFLNK